MNELDPMDPLAKEVLDLMRRRLRGEPLWLKIQAVRAVFLELEVSLQALKEQQDGPQTA